MEFGGGVSQGGGFAASDVAGDDGGGAEVQGVEEAFRCGLEARQGVEIFHTDILTEGFFLEAEKGFIAHGPPPRRVFRRCIWVDRPGVPCFAPEAGV